MSRVLIDMLTRERGWPRLDAMEALAGWVGRPGVHCLFIPGDPAKNLESGDVAVILPELVQAFQGAFDAAVVGDAIERETRDRFDVWPTPSLIFVAAGRPAGAIPRVRDWDEYLVRVREILAAAAAPAQ